ncbi:NAD(P)/FAD-dependent oxidoreductase [Enterococcus entomosocium]|uniref:NAD(P)/FAD-dependent oxidoreductase n=1 Tax=Enterococcus entomosocium TaxID=3034352 RepID=UPI003D6A9ADF
MKFDCLVIGGGPAGANAALVLGRAKLSVLLIDNLDARNKVTHESHGFITNDSLPPQVIKEKGIYDLQKYSSITLREETVLSVKKINDGFHVETNKNVYYTQRLVLASGLKEQLPEIPGITQVYGSHFFNCPFCDGWELKDKQIALITEQPQITHFVAMVSHWSRNLRIYTNGNLFDKNEKQILEERKIPINEEKIHFIDSKDDKIAIHTPNSSLVFQGGFLMPTLTPRINYLKNIPLDLTEFGRISTDSFGKTSYPNIYAAGDIQMIGGEQLVHAASSGSRTASVIVQEVASKEFDNWF